MRGFDPSLYERPFMRVFCGRIHWFKKGSIQGVWVAGVVAGLSFELGL